MPHWHFDSPWALLALLLLPLLWWYQRRSHRQAVLFLPTIIWIKGVGSPLRRWAFHGQEWLRFAAFSLLIIALARPQLVNSEIERLSEGVDIILAIDTSGSMQAMDFVVDGKRVDRLSVIKQVAGDFIASRTADRIGVVVFGDKAFTQCPPTLDHQIVQRFLDWCTIGMAGKGTAIGSALGVSIKRLQASNFKSKLIILLTDGKSNAGNIDPLEAAKIAKTLGIKIHTIGVGSKGPVPFPVNDVFGTRLIYQQFDQDEEALQTIAKTTGGLYFNATDTKSLQEIYKQIDSMEKTEIKTREFKQYDEQFLNFLIPAMLLLALITLTENSWLRRVP